MIQKLVPQLYVPEDIVIQNFDESADLYIVAKGECKVKILNE